MVPEYEAATQQEFARFALGHIGPSLSSWLSLEDSQVRDSETIPMEKGLLTFFVFPAPFLVFK